MLDRRSVLGFKGVLKAGVESSETPGWLVCSGGVLCCCPVEPEPEPEPPPPPIPTTEGGLGGRGGVVVDLTAVPSPRSTAARTSGVQATSAGSLCASFGCK